MPLDGWQQGRMITSGGAVLDNVERKRQESILELISSEEVYVTDLTKMLMYYRDAMISENVVSEDDIQIIFCNVETLCYYNCSLSEALQQRQEGQYPVVQDISDILLDFFQHAYDAYSNFCLSVRGAMSHFLYLKKTNPSFARLIAEVDSNEAVGPLGLDSYLLKPLQRLTRYPLLVAAILNNTKPSHESYESTCEALVAAKGCVQCINDSQRRLEDMNELFDLQGILDFTSFAEEPVLPQLGRRLLFQGEIAVDMVTKRSSGKREHKRLLAFLLSDMLILAKKPRGPAMATNHNKPLNNSSANGSQSGSSVLLNSDISLQIPKRSMSASKLKSSLRTDRQKLNVVCQPLSLATATHGYSDGKQVMMLSSSDGTLVHISPRDPLGREWIDVLDNAVQGYKEAQCLPVPVSRPVLDVNARSCELLSCSGKSPERQSGGPWPPLGCKESHTTSISSYSSTVSPLSARDDDALFESLTAASSTDIRRGVSMFQLVHNQQSNWKKSSRKHRLSFGMLTRLGKNPKDIMGDNDDYDMEGFPQTVGHPRSANHSAVD